MRPQSSFLFPWLLCWSNFSRPIGPIEPPQNLGKYVFWPCEAIPALRFPRKIQFLDLFCKKTQILAAPDTTALSSDGKIRGQNVGLHQNLNRVDLSSTSWRIRQCKNISPTPIQWLGVRSRGLQQAHQHWSSFSQH